MSSNKHHLPVLFPLKHPICLGRLMHALTRYDSRCDLTWLLSPWLADPAVASGGKLAKQGQGSGTTWA